MTSASLLSGNESFATKCKICSQSQEVLHVLPCSHFFCKQCINTHCKSECHECKVPHYLQMKKLEDLPKIADKISSIIKCFNDGSSASAQRDKCGLTDYYCFTCQYALCDKCYSDHKKSNPSHSIKKLKEINNTDMTKKATCSDSEHKLTWFCSKCEQATCNSCYALFHKHHNFVSTEQALADYSLALRKIAKTEEAVWEERHKLQQEISSVAADANQLLMKEVNRISNIIDSQADDYARSIKSALDNKVKQALRDKASKEDIVGLLQKVVAPKADGREPQTTVTATTYAQSKPNARNNKAESLGDMSVSFDSFQVEVTKWKSDITKWLQPVIDAAAKLPKLPVMESNLTGEKSVNTKR